MTFDRSRADATLVALMQASLGGPLIKLGRFAEGEAALRDAMAVLERVGSAQLVSVLNTLAMLVLWRSEGHEAGEATLAAQSIALYERIGFDTGLSSARDSLGQALRALGRIDAARAQRVLAAGSGGPIVECEAKFHLALLAAADRVAALTSRGSRF